MKHEKLADRYYRKRARDLRLKYSLTITELAKRLGRSKSWVSKIENGQLSFPDNYLSELSKALNVPGEERRSLLEIDVWDFAKNNASVVDVAKRLQPYQEHASRVCSYNPVYLSAYTQTRAYSEAILSGVNFKRPNKQDYLPALEIRERIKKNIIGKEISIIITESCLYGPFAPSNIMPNQICHLLDLCEQEDLNIVILPRAAPVQTNVLYGINIYDDSIVVSENFFGAGYTADPEEIERAKRIFESLFALSLVGRKRFAALQAALKFHQRKMRSR